MLPACRLAGSPLTFFFVSKFAKLVSFIVVLKTRKILIFAVTVVVKVRLILNFFV
jgi:hypothetical protein